jgi:hypothetical protein
MILPRRPYDFIAGKDSRKRTGKLFFMFFLFHKILSLRALDIFLKKTEKKQ